MRNFTMKKNWSKQVSNIEAARRAAGRRRINAQRKKQAFPRRMAILQLVSVHGKLLRGQQKELAEKYAVHKSAISRDYKWALNCCGGMVGSGIMPTVSFRGAKTSFTWTYRG